MTTAVWKWDLEVTDVQKLTMPIQAEILCVQVQNGIPRLWTLVNVNALTEDRTIITLGTGHPIEFEKLGEYIGTYQLHGGTLVFHVFNGCV